MEQETINESPFEKIKQTIGEFLGEQGMELEENQKIEESIASSDPEEKLKIFSELKGSKIASMVNDCLQNKINEEELPFLLKKELPISFETADNLSEKLKKEILRIKSVPEEKKKMEEKKDAYRETTE